MSTPQTPNVSSPSLAGGTFSPAPPLPRTTTPLRTVSSSSSTNRSIYDRSLQRSRGTLSLSAFAFMFAESVSYAHKQAKGISDLEGRLNKLGYHVGVRVAELLVLRAGKAGKRENKLIDALQLVHTPVWRTLFGAPMDAIEKSTDNDRQYMLIDDNPLVAEFISVPKDLSQLNCAAFAGGVIEAVLCSTGFRAKVGAHSVPVEGKPCRTVFLVEFA